MLRGAVIGVSKSGCWGTWKDMPRVELLLKIWAVRRVKRPGEPPTQKGESQSAMPQSLGEDVAWEGGGRRVELPHARRRTESLWNQVSWPVPPGDIWLGQEHLSTASMMPTGTFILVRPTTVSIPAVPGRRRKTGGSEGCNNSFFRREA